MKTTIEIDERKLKRVMRLTGIKTRRKAIAYALVQAERTAQVESVLKGDFFTGLGKEIIDPTYDLSKIRSLDRTKKKRGDIH